MPYPGYGPPNHWPWTSPHPYPPYGEHYPPGRYQHQTYPPGPYGFQEYGLHGPSPHGLHPPHPNFHAPSPHDFHPRPPNFHAPNPQGFSPHNPHHSRQYGHIPPVGHQMPPEPFPYHLHPAPPPVPAPPLPYEGYWQHQHPYPPDWGHAQHSFGYPPHHTSNMPPRPHQNSMVWRNPSTTSNSKSPPATSTGITGSTLTSGKVTCSSAKAEVQSSASSPGSSAMKIDSEVSSPEEPSHVELVEPTKGGSSIAKASRSTTAVSPKLAPAIPANPGVQQRIKVDAQQPVVPAKEPSPKVQNSSISDTGANAKKSPSRLSQSQPSSPEYTPCMILPDRANEAEETFPPAKHAEHRGSLPGVPETSTPNLVVKGELDKLTNNGNVASTNESKSKVVHSEKPGVTAYDLVEEEDSVHSDDSYSPPPAATEPTKSHAPPAAAFGSNTHVPQFGYDGFSVNMDGFPMGPPPPPPMHPPPPPPPGSPPQEMCTDDRSRTPNWGTSDKQLPGTPPISSVPEEELENGEVEGSSKLAPPSVFEHSRDGTPNSSIVPSIERPSEVDHEHKPKRAAKWQSKSSRNSNEADAAKRDAQDKSESSAAPKRKNEADEDQILERKLRRRTARRYIL